MKYRPGTLLLFLSLVVICACTSAPEKPAQPAEAKAEAPTLYTGREAIYKMYIAARNWTGDAQPFRLEAQPTKAASGKDGKYAVWRASFGSASRHTAKTFTWSGVKEQDAPEPGTSFGAEETYNPSNSFTKTFDVAFLKSDSDKAVQVATQHGGEKLVKQNANMPVICVAEWDTHENSLLWHVQFGGTGSEAKLTVLVNATTGDFVRVEK